LLRQESDHFRLFKILLSFFPKVVIFIFPNPVTELFGSVFETNEKKKIFYVHLRSEHLLIIIR